MENDKSIRPARAPWNKGKLTGQKLPLKLPKIWAIRVRLQLSTHPRDLAMFKLAIESKLRACDLTKLRVLDISHGQHVSTRYRHTTENAASCSVRNHGANSRSVEAWIKATNLAASDFLFPSRIHGSPHISTRQYARIVHRWVASIGLDERDRVRSIRTSRTKCAAVRCGMDTGQLPFRAGGDAAPSAPLSSIA
jgi:integrase